MSAIEEDANVPPASQSHFSKFENFTPNDNESFDHEFARLASSQQWIPGSQQYTRQRTIAMRQELELHYFSQSQPLDENDEEPTAKLSEEDKLKGYQALCLEVRIPPCDSIDECQKKLKSTLVNIVDLIDARRTNKEVEVWHDFGAFRDYTLQDEHRINKEEAKKGPGYLASLLQDFRGPNFRGPRSRRKRAAAGKGTGARVSSGRVTKKSHGRTIHVNTCIKVLNI